jgi:hypothetical protein
MWIAGGMMRPEDSALFQQEVISHAELAPAVAEGTRSTFERLRSPSQVQVRNSGA